MDRIQRYQETNHFRMSRQANWENFRFTCMDTESTGFDPRRDRLISIAGIGLSSGEIHLWDQISLILPVPYNTSSVTVHGITREASAGGVEEPEALARFLAWLSDGIIVGHHIQHDLTLLNIACRKHHSLVLRNLAIDTMEAYTAVREAGGFAGRPPPLSGSLDSLCEYFRIVPHDRHTAPGDAFLTSQVLLRILKEAGKLGLWNLEDLHAWYADEPFPFTESP
ncbi:MAG: 3'-5' exonuclease [Oceanipulchritudo sp.]